MNACAELTRYKQNEQKKEHAKHLDQVIAGNFEIFEVETGRQMMGSLKACPKFQVRR